MNHAISVSLGANIDKYKAGMDAAKRMGTESLGFIATIFDKIKNMFSGLWDSVKSLFSGWGDKSKSTFDSMSSSASGALQKVSGYLSSFTSDMGKAGDKMSETDEKSSSLASRIGTTLVAAFTALLVVTAALVAKGLMVDAAFAGIATQTDIAVSQLSRFDAVAARNGMSIKELGTNMGKFHEEMVKAAQGDGSDEFAKLGVKVTDANGALRQTDEVLLEASKKVAGLSSEAEKYGAAAKLGFDGKAQFLEDTAHAGTLVARVTDEQAAAAVQLGKTWHEIGSSGPGVVSQMSDKLTSTLTPAMLTASQAILEGKNRIVEAFSQMFGGGDLLDKLAKKIQGWAESSSKWFAGVTKSATDTAVSLMQVIAARTGMGDPNALKPTGTGYMPVTTPVTSGKTETPITEAEKAARAQIEATNKSVGDRIAVMQKQIELGRTLTEGERAALQLGTSKANLSASELAADRAKYDSLSKLELQFKSMQDAQAQGEAAAKKEAEAFATLMSRIQGNIDENALALLSNENLTESQKMMIKLDAELASGKLKLSSAHVATAKAKLQDLAVSEDLIKAQAAEKESMAWMQQSAQARNAATASLEVEYSMYGKTSDARDIAMIAVKAEADLEKFLAEERKKNIPISEEQIAQLQAEKDMRVAVEQATLAQTKALGYATQLAEENKRFGLEYIVDDKQRAAAQLAIEADLWRKKIALAGDGTEAQRAFQEQFDTWYANQSIKPALDEQKQMWGSIESTAHDTFISIFDSGKSAFDRLRDTLKNGLLDLLYQMTIKKWIISISGSVGLGASSLAQATGDGPATGVAASNPLLGAVSTASSIYKAITGGFDKISSTVSGGIDSLLGQFGPGTIGSTGPSGIASAGGTAASYGAGILAGHYIGNAIAGDYSVNHGQAVTNIASVVGALAAGPLGGAIGGAIGGLLNRAFGIGDKKVTGQGISGTLSAGTLTGQSYSSWHQDGGWFRSDKNGTDTTALTAAMVAQFTQGLGAIEVASSGFAKSLGVSADWVDSYSKTFDLKLTGDATKDQQLVTDFFAGIGDEIANRLVPNLADFSKSGETASATLERLAGDFKGTDQVAQLLGKSAAQLFGSAGLDSAKAREGLINAAGGLSVLSQQAQSFNQNFLTDAERLAPVQEALGAALASIGYASLQTRDDFKNAVNGLLESGAAATDEGAKKVAELLGLADAFAQVHPDTSAAIAQKAADVAAERKTLQDQVDELTMTAVELLAKQRAAVDVSNQGLFDQVQALKAQAAAAQEAAQAQAAAAQAAKDAAAGLLSNVDTQFSVLQKVVARQKAVVQSTVDARQAAADLLQGLSDTIRSTLDGMRTADQKLTDRASAQAEIRADLAITKAGGSLSSTQIASLKTALGAVNQDASDKYGSYAEYLKDLYSTQADIAQLGDVTDDSLSVEKQALQAAQAQLASLDAVLTNAQDQIDVLKGQSTTLLSIDQAVKSFGLVMLSAQANPVNAATSAISQAYQSALGRAPDAAGLAYYQQSAANGNSLADIVKSIQTSPEAQVQQLYQSILGRSADAGGLQYWVNSGASMADIAASMKASDEYKHLHDIPGFMDGGLFGGGLRIVGENGPELEATGASRIWNANQTASFLQGGSGGDQGRVFADSVNQLTKSVDRQQAALDQQADDIKQMRRDAKRTADTLERVTRGGNAMATTIGGVS